jgi:hypothetical protein
LYFYKKTLYMANLNSLAAGRILSCYNVELNDVEKGGEGSRGGKVIGHTKSGKPIYEKYEHSSHKNFSHKEHLDAVALLKQQAKNPQGSELKYNSSHPSWKEAEKHYDAAVKKESTRGKHIGDMSKPELHEAAVRLGIKGHELMSKTDLAKKVLDANVDKQIKEFQAKKKVEKAEEQDVEKAEGDRGGKVIGHTKSGKAIYAHQGASDVKDFSPQDHKDAADAHHKHADEREKEEGVIGRKTANKHRDSHIDASQAKQEEDKKIDKKDPYQGAQDNFNKKVLNKSFDEYYSLLKGEEIVNDIEKSEGDADESLMKAAETPEQKAKMEKVMKEFKEGKLKSSSGELVTERSQAIAIAMSEAGITKAK